MSRPRLLPALCGALLAPLLALSLPAAARAAEPAARADEAPVRILLTGDSLTHGRHLDATWRYWVDRELRRQRVDFDLVGSSHTPHVDPAYGSSRYLHPGFDGDHAARAGATLGYLTDVARSEVATQRPDVVVLLAGVNDMLRGATAGEAETRLRAWIAQVRAVQPVTRIVLGEVLSTDRQDTTNARIAEYNRRLRQVAAGLTTPDSPISVVSTGRGWSATGSLSSDGIHLSPTGETLVAERIAQGLHDIGVLPQQPRLFRSLPWTRVERPVVGTQIPGRALVRAQVRWGMQALTSAEVRYRPTGGRWVATSLGARSATTLTLRPGTRYEVQLRVSRVRMSGPWGPSALVKVAPRVRPAAPSRVEVRPRAITWSAVPGARSYEVRYRTSTAQQRWTTRTVRATRLPVRRVVQAQVRATSGAGHSVWRASR